MKSIKRLLSLILIFAIISGYTYAVDTADDFTVDVTFWSINEYCEYILPGNRILGTDITIKNNSTEIKTIYPYFALYENKILIDVKQPEEIVLDIGEEVFVQETFSVDTQNTGAYTIKVLNLGNDINPISPSASINGTKSDYYGNTIDKAVLISNTQKQVVGSVNFSEDVDFVKFTPTYSGDYTFNCISINNISAVLFNYLIIQPKPCNYTQVEE